MRDCVAFLLAGGMGSRLNILAKTRAKPAVPFGGNYRIIDFTLSNIMHSGIDQVGILTQYQPYSLMQHIRSGEAWDFIGRSRSARILPPSTGINASDWYRGTADAVAQNLNFAKRFNARQVLVLSGDHIYHMDYRPMMRFHKKRKADITVAMMHVPWRDTKHFGIATVDRDQRILDWQEKPDLAKNNLASMGVYVIEMKYLERVLQNAKGFDFGKNIIHDAVINDRVFAYPFDGYWADVGTLRAFWNSNMDILRRDSGLNLCQWHVRTNLDDEGHVADRLPTRFGKNAQIKNSLISFGCFVDGQVIHSILSPGVRIEKGARVIDSVIMHDVVVKQKAQLTEVIADKRAYFGAQSEIGVGEASQPNEKFPKHIFTGLTVIGKAAQIPAMTKLYRNTIIEPFCGKDVIAAQGLHVGSYVKQRRVKNAVPLTENNFS
ncbi:MAG: NTP transferase domain-containing protein [Calditrichaeota bacterium]|nr:NTP transferase domain-containing protein [Calditrichota bacterium]